MRIEEAFLLAQKRNIALAHFNASGLESFDAIAFSASKAKMPVIVGVSEGAIKHAGLDFFIWAKDFFQKKYRCDIFLHLDHGKDLDLIERVIKSGFNSVMIDASMEKYERNVFLTRYIAKKAKKKGVWVEAELGVMGHEEGGSFKREYTDPALVRDFIKRTGCDSLAVSIGTAHGAFKNRKKGEINLDILKKISAITDMPLVLHGASSLRPDVVSGLEKQGIKIKKSYGINDKEISDAVKLGIRKVNTDTDLNLAGILELIKSVRKGESLKLYKLLEKSKEAMAEEAIKKIKLFSGRK